MMKNNKVLVRNYIVKFKQAINSSFYLLLVLLFMSFGLAGANGEAMTTSTGNDKQLNIGFTIALEGDDFDINRSYYLAHVEITLQTFTPLLRQRDDGEIRSGAAKSWQIENGNRRIRFILRDDLRWSNGDPVEAAHFVEGIKRMLLDGRANAANLAGVAGLDAYFKNRDDKVLGVSAPNTNELVIEFTNAYQGDFKSFSIPLIVAISPKDTAPNLAEDFAKMPERLTYGAYRFKSIADELIVLEKNPFSPELNDKMFDEIFYYGNKDKDIYQAYRDGEMDIILGPNGDNMRQLLGDYKEETIQNPYPRIYTLVQNTKLKNLTKPILSALNIAIDRQALSHLFDKQNANPLYSVVPPGIARYSELTGLESQEGDSASRLIKARKTMAELGYSAASPMKISLVLAEEVPGYEKIATFLKSNWAEIYVDLNISYVGGYLDALEAFKDSENEFVMVSSISDNNNVFRYLYNCNQVLNDVNLGMGAEYRRLLKLVQENEAYQNFNDYVAAVDRHIISEYYFIPIISHRPGFLVRSNVMGVPVANRYTRPALQSVDLFRKPAGN